jgi:hypothetical protein
MNGSSCVAGCASQVHAMGATREQNWRPRLTTLGDYSRIPALPAISKKSVFAAVAHGALHFVQNLTANATA